MPDAPRPLFSIVTACYNAANCIADSIRSVTMQDMDPAQVEYVFVDGGSGDATLDIIKTEARHTCQICSEKDDGIYDAMNKGISMARGEWLLFLNADDRLASADVLSRFAAAIRSTPEAEFIYGKAANIQDGRLLNYTGSPITPDQYWYPVQCMCHQAIFFHRRLFEQHGRFEVGIAGGISDYVWLARYFRAPHGKTLFVDSVVCEFTEGGYSLTHIWDAYMALLNFARDFFPWSIRLRFYRMYPKKFLKFRILRLHQDTAFRRAYRSFMRAVVHNRQLRTGL